MDLTRVHPSSADLAAWIDARLTMWEGAQIGLHLAGCLTCRSLVAEIRQTLIAVRDDEKEDVRS